MQEINDSKLKEEFGLEVIDISEEIEKPSSGMPVYLPARDPAQILYNNIDRANRFLDRLERKIDEDDSIESRQVEVAAKMLDSITQAAERIFTTQLEYDTLSLKTKFLDLKQRELDIKEKIGLLQSGAPRSQNNILIADRESILRVIREKSQEKEKLLYEGEVKENDNVNAGISAGNSGTEGEG